MKMPTRIAAVGSATTAAATARSVRLSKPSPPPQTVTNASPMPKRTKAAMKETVEVAVAKKLPQGNSKKSTTKTVTVDVEMEPSKETELPEVRKESPVVSSESTTNNDRKEDQDQVKINTADADAKPGKAEMIEKT